jgi:hypothetical protein
VQNAMEADIISFLEIVSECKEVAETEEHSEENIKTESAFTKTVFESDTL